MPVHPIDLLLPALAVVVAGQQLWMFFERRRTRRREELFQVITENAADLIALVDTKGKRLYNSPSYRRVLGYSPAELAEQSGFEQIHPEDRFRVLDAAREARETGTGREIEYRMRHKNGEWRVMQSSASTIRDANGKVAKLVIVNRDVTERKRAEQRLEHESLHDALTGLPNRQLFLDRLHHALARSRRNDAFRFALLTIDVDDFRRWNRDLGQEGADQLLVELSQRIAACVREDDSVGVIHPLTLDPVSRLSADEFSVLLEGVGEPGDALRVGRRIQQALAAPYASLAPAPGPTVSIGIVLNGARQATTEMVLGDLDDALRRAKARGGNSCEVSDHVQHARAVQRLSQESDLRTALEQSQFRVHYQPVVRLVDRQVLELEALLRWQHPTEGLISPDKFLDTADDSGLLVEIGSWLFCEIGSTLRTWSDSGELPEALAVSANLSARQWGHPRLLTTVKSALAQFHIAPSRLRVEIPESVALRNLNHTTSAIADFRHAGIQTSLDHVGSGLSSLRLLAQAQLCCLKLDRSLVQELHTDRTAEHTVAMIVAVARTARVPVVGESIEDQWQLERLRTLGCGLGQGFLLSPPVPAHEAERLLLAGVLS